MRKVFLRSIALTVCVIMLSVCTAFSFSACKKEDEPVLPSPVFEDNFDTLDTSVWNVYDCVRRGGYWAPECVYIEDGNLIIETKVEEGIYYTGAIDSAGKYENTFGYYETRCKIPPAYGIWAAFWLMCDKMGLDNPDATVGGAEIDIFESPYYPSKWFQCAMHMGGYGANTLEDGRINTKGGDNLYTDWHTFGLDWQADGYKFYYDNVLYYETDCNDNVSTVDGFLFLSVEIGGTNGNVGDSPFFPFHSPEKNPSDSWPQRFVVDYVRVYEKKP